MFINTLHGCKTCSIPLYLIINSACDESDSFKSLLVSFFSTPLTYYLLCMKSTTFMQSCIILNHLISPPHRLITFFITFCREAKMAYCFACKTLKFAESGSKAHKLIQHHQIWKKILIYTPIIFTKPINTYFHLVTLGNTSVIDFFYIYN